jgi:peptidoglycan/xylan/chitin deacetylase (PgdA/CDA1 family)
MHVRRCYENNWDGARAALTFSFDDGFKQTYELVEELLHEYGLKATFFIPVNYVGSSICGIQTVSWHHLKKCISSGMEIGSHSLTHREFSTSIINRLNKLMRALIIERPTLTYLKYIINEQFHRSDALICDQNRIYYEIMHSKTLLEKMLNPYKVSSFAYPHGSFNRQYKEFVRLAGYKSARSTLRGYNYSNHLDKYALRAMVWHSFTKVKIANKWIDEALKKGAWLIEVIHLISRDGLPMTDETITLDRFKEHMDYVLAKEKLLWIETQQNIIDYIAMQAPS